jgi:hypothetical protein
MRVLGHAAALISVKVNVVDVKGSSDERLSVSAGYLLITSSSGEARYSEKALINCAKIDVNLDLVVLKSNKRKSKTRVLAEPELKRNVKSGLRKGIARSAYLARGRRIARAINISKVRISQESELSGLANHLVVATLLVLVKSQLIPDLHPVTVMLVNALTANLNLNVINELVAREIKPTSVYVRKRDCA